MKTHILTIAFVFVAAQLLAQNTNQPFHLQDSLKKIESTTNQREKAEVYLNLGQHYGFIKGDSALFYLTEAERTSKQENLIDLLPYIYSSMSDIEGKVTTNYPMSLYHAFEELKSLKEMQYRYEVPG